MSRKTIKAFEERTGRKSPGAQGVTFRDAAKPGLGPSRFQTTGCPECDEEIRTGKPCPFEGAHTCEQAQRLAADPTGSNGLIRRLVRDEPIDVTDTRKYAPTLPPPPASVEVSCLLARAKELEDTAHMMLARAAELREVAEKAKG